MKQYRSLFLQFIYWMLVFFLQRVLFLVYYWQTIANEEIPVGEIFRTFTSALKLDMATVSYVMAFPFLLLVIQLFTSARLINILNKIYSFIILFVYLLISVGELGLYGEWKSKLSYKALSYLRNPDEIFNSVSTGSFILLVIILLVQVLVLFWIYNKYFYRTGYSIEKRKFLPKILFVIPVTGFFISRGPWRFCRDPNNCKRTVISQSIIFLTWPR